MLHANSIYTKGTSITLVTLILICFLISCKYESHNPCLDEKDIFNATVAEDGRATNHLSSEPCNSNFHMFEGDSLVLSGFGIDGPTGLNINITLVLINIKSTGEYAFGIERVPGEPWVECTYARSEGGWAYHSYYTDEILGPGVGSGMLTIDNLSSDYISGTFHAELYDFNTSPSNITKITAGIFSFSLK